MKFFLEFLTYTSRVLKIKTELRLLGHYVLLKENESHFVL